MTVEGHIENGRIILNEPLSLTEGMRVRVELIDEGVPAQPPDTQSTGPTLHERIKPFVGSMDGLPIDLATNHDHYLHGQPKRQ